ncbi:GNAT family N-acetyltransferase [Psychromonas ossibalaenae]|uniref:GNAT family N-acetyltransferase n=1 Tax=Psychromonas ossibalaenae TaxID=444922 RepID=UPI00037E2090|nr:GNAT family N-acetyltransferase [Psychromonas ossibalaenae]
MSYHISEIQPADDKTICNIIKSVGIEHGAVGEGFGPSDPEVECMSSHYNGNNNSRYLVAKIDGRVVGGGGIAPFNGSSETCELRKLFLLPESRGFGIGKALTEQCLDYAKSQGYLHCYLDTLSAMKPAIKLYENAGFRHLAQPLAGTIHGSCDVWMLKEL